MILSEDVLNHWSGGQLLAFSGLDGPTDFYQGLTARTAFAGAALDFKAPGACHVHFSSEVPDKVLLAGDFFELSLGGSVVRGAFLDAHHFLIDGPCEAREADARLCIFRDGGKTLIASPGRASPGLIAADLDAAIADRKKWLQGLGIPPGLSLLARRTLAKCLSQMKTMVYSPEGVIRHRFSTPDRWPHQGMWLWDSVFHAIGFRHVDLALARDLIEAVFDGQHPDGMVPIRTDPDSHFSQTITQPPLLAFGVKLIDEMTPDDDWIAGLYPKLKAYLDWDLSHRARPGSGLAVWATGDNVNCRCDESGMDNSPRFDSGTNLEAVDFNSYLAQEFRIMAGFAGQLGLKQDSAMWHERYALFNRQIHTRLWSDEHRFYVDKDLSTDVLASVGFLPLLTDAPSADQVWELARHIHDPASFGTQFPVPSVPASCAAYQKDMWRGPTWVNLNWLIAYGFERHGLLSEAAFLRAKTCGEIERWYERSGTLFEYYDDRCELTPEQLCRKGKCAPEESVFHQVMFDYGWTATLYVDLMMRKTTC